MDSSYTGDDALNDAGFETGAATLDRAGSDRGGIVTARGTNDGLVIRLDGRVELASLKAALSEFLETRKGFLQGNPVALEWVGLKPADILVNEISDLLSAQFGIKVRSSKLRENVKPLIAPGSGAGLASSVSVISADLPTGDDALELFSGVESIEIGEHKFSSLAGESSEALTDALVWDDPDARVVYTTLRSGQKIETEHSLVIFGDVNSGAEIVAGGDIAVLGTLRGVAHAGAYDETGGGRFIFALNLAPTQLRIGSIISRGSADSQKGAEIARVEANMIVVEPYQSRNFVTKRRS